LISGAFTKIRLLVDGVDFVFVEEFAAALLLLLVPVLLFPVLHDFDLQIEFFIAEDCIVLFELGFLVAYLLVLIFSHFDLLLFVRIVECAEFVDFPDRIQQCFFLLGDVETLLLEEACPVDHKSAHHRQRVEFVLDFHFELVFVVNGTDERESDQVWGQVFLHWFALHLVDETVDLALVELFVHLVTGWIHNKQLLFEVGAFVVCCGIDNCRVFTDIIVIFNINILIDIYIDIGSVFLF